jgi:deoxyribose-phosphate aldolase
LALADSNIDLALYIDHALLAPTATSEQINQCCQEAMQFNFPAICIYPSAVKEAAEILHKKSTQICAVIGFPIGATTSATKLYEAQEALDNGARELDVVINLGWLKSGRSEDIYQEIARICEETGIPVKAIIETNLLANTEKRLATEICMDAGVAFIKTCTGWFGGATVADVKLLRDITKGQIGIKASGGIRTYEQALALIEAGATRLGTSRGVELIRSRKGESSFENESNLSGYGH